MRLRCLLMSAVALLMLGGCYPLTIDATGLESQVYMTPPTVARQPVAQQVGTMNTRITGSWLLFGLLPLREPDIEGTVRREVTRLGGTGVSGLTITTQYTFIDSLLGIITLGIYSQRSVVLEGSVVQGAAAAAAATSTGEVGR